MVVRAYEVCRSSSLRYGYDNDRLLQWLIFRHSRSFMQVWYGYDNDRLLQWLLFRHSRSFMQ
ncbi:hypothetical protein Tco_0106716, partial [Tanacetum coccineum]